MKIFISYPFHDIKNKDSLTKALSKLDYDVITKVPTLAPEVQNIQNDIKTAIDSSDIVLLIISMFNPPRDVAEEFERWYNYAREINKPILCFEYQLPEGGVRQSSHPEKGTSLIIKSIMIAPDNETTLNKLLHKMAITDIVRYWGSTEELVESVIKALQQFERYEVGRNTLSFVGSESTPLTLLIDPGTASPEFIADILSDISVIYRLSGGSGIKFTIDYTHVFEGTGL